VRASVRGVFSVAALLCTAAGLTYTAMAIAGMRKFRRRICESRSSFSSPVSVLKPLHGDEPHLYENLSSFCEQDYPSFQIIFGAADPNDPALDTARRVQRTHPECDIAIVAGSPHAAANPKVGNLKGMMPAVKHSLLIIADSDIRVERSYLRAVASSFADPKVGAATCIYAGVSNGTPVSHLGALYVNEHFSPSVLAAQVIEPLSYCFGATMAVRNHVLNLVGGLEALADQLGDDYVLGNLVRRAGFTVELCPYVVQTYVAERSIRGLLARELRWARTVRACRPAGYAGSVIMHVLLFSMLFALSSGAPLAGAAAVAAAAWARALLHCEARKTFAPQARVGLWLLPVRDFLTVGVWCASFLGRGVTWKGDRYRVGACGRMPGRPSECNNSV
jgi:ceramide glucosyltransferase